MIVDVEEGEVKVDVEAEIEVEETLVDLIEVVEVG